MFVESKARPIRRADNLAAICEPDIETAESVNTGSSTFSPEVCRLVGRRPESGKRYDRGA
jgi:hypothetical protein